MCLFIWRLCVWGASHFVNFIIFAFGSRFIEVVFALFCEKLIKIKHAQAREHALLSSLIRNSTGWKLLCARGIIIHNRFTLALEVRPQVEVNFGIDFLDKWFMAPAQDPKQVNLLRLGNKPRCQDLVARIGQQAFGNQDLVATIF